MLMGGAGGREVIACVGRQAMGGVIHLSMPDIARHGRSCGSLRWRRAVVGASVGLVRWW